MSKQELIDQIVDKVIEALSQYEAEARCQTEIERRVKVLLISWHASRGYWSFKENEKLKASCDMHFSFDEQQIVRPEQYDQIVVCDLDTANLSNLIAGQFNNLYLKLLAQSIMLGKRVMVIADDVDSVKYSATAPKQLLQMIEKKLSILSDWGISIVSETDCIRQLECLQERSKGYFIAKRIITKKDVEWVHNKEYRSICVKKKAIVSDIAKEYLEKYQMTVTYF